MNKIWIFILVVSITMIVFQNPNNVLVAFSSASNKAVKLTFELMAIYAIWSGFLKILDETGFPKKLAKWLSPVTNFLFGKNISTEAKQYLTMNISTNIIGLGGAATPLGIKAIEHLDDGKRVASTPMIMLVVLCSTSLQLIPTSIIGLMTQHGSNTPSVIILPSIIAGAVSTIVGVTLVKICAKIFKRK